MSNQGAVVGLDGCAVRAVDADRVSATRERLIGPAEAGALADGFKLLGDPNRVRILYALSEAGEPCVCDLTATDRSSPRWSSAPPAARTLWAQAVSP